LGEARIPDGFSGKLLSEAKILDDFFGKLSGEVTASSEAVR